MKSNLIVLVCLFVIELSLKSCYQCPKVEVENVNSNLSYIIIKNKLKLSRWAISIKVVDNTSVDQINEWVVRDNFAVINKLPESIALVIYKNVMYIPRVEEVKINEKYLVKCSEDNIYAIRVTKPMIIYLTFRVPHRVCGKVIRVNAHNKLTIQQ